jgi:integrase
MASLSKNQQGNWRIQFVNESKNRITFWVGRISERHARTVYRHVEELIEARICRRPVTKETAVWLQDADPVLLGKLAKVQLVEKVAVVQKPTFSELASEYFARKDIEESTKSTRHFWHNSIVEILRDKPCDQYTPEDGDRLRDKLLDKGLAYDTVKRMLRFAQQILLKAVPKHLPESPLSKLVMNHRDNQMPNREYISRERFEEVLAVLPPAWQMMAALARLGGLRCPSEGLLVRWKDVRLEEKAPKLYVTSPKTKSKGKPWRRVPICPRLGEILRGLKPKQCSGDDFLVDLPSYRTARKGGWHGVNTRQQFTKILESSGVGRIKAAFKVFRSSCQTDWAQDHAIHVVAAWAGNTAAVAAKHYLTLVDEDWIKATSITPAANRMIATAPTKTQEPVNSTLSCTKNLVVGRIAIEGSRDVSTESNLSTITGSSSSVSQVVSHPMQEMGGLEGNSGFTQNSQVSSRTQLTPTGLVCPNLSNYPARIRT